MSKWRAIGLVALVAASSLGGEASSAAETEGPTIDDVRDEARDLARPAPDGASEEAAARVAPTSRAGAGDLSAAALPPGLCYGASYGDPNEAGDGLIDVTSYALGFECEQSIWVLDAVTVDNWSDLDLGWYDLMIDSDRNLNTGCGGVDHYYQAWYEFDGSQVIQWYISARTPNCDVGSWTSLSEPVSLVRSAANQVTMVIPTGRFAGVQTLRWQSSIAHLDANDPIDNLPDGYISAGQYRTAPGNPCGGRCFFLKNSLSGGPADVYFRDTQPATEIIYGDWNGDGIDSMGYRNGTGFVLKNAHAATGPDYSFQYGRSTDRVYVGDWDGNGTDTLAVRRGATYYFGNTLGSPVADSVVTYGRPDDVVLVGDWDGNGTDTLAVRRRATYYIKNSISGGPADSVVIYGRADDAVLAGDWDGNGTDTLAVRRGANYFIKNSISGGAADTVVTYGRPTDITFTGDWNADGVDTLGVRR
jgi:hypothetical protein